MASDKITVISARPERFDLLLGLREVWQYRRLFIIFAQRSIRGRYVHTYLGMIWALAQPLAYMTVLYLFFGLLNRFPSDGAPYPIFLLTGLVAYQFFARSLGDGANSLLSQNALLEKLYVPKLIFPLSANGVAATDFVVSLGLLVLFLTIFGVLPDIRVVFFPAFFLLLCILGIAVSVLFSALTIRYRDLRPALQTITQLFFFATPIFYPISLIPERYHAYYGLNPLVGIVEGFRWSLLSLDRPLSSAAVTSSVLVSTVLLIVALAYFHRVQRNLSDVI